jgi:hypothetical protein
MISDYYSLLGLPYGSTVDAIKKAYRKKAREYHPDLNPSVNAMDMFIRVTEAYEFLITHFAKINKEDDSFNTDIEDWNLHSRDIARKRAKAYARASYIQFKNTRFYKTTRILDATTIIFSMVIAICVILFAIYGYIWRLRHTLYGEERPSVASFILLLSLGVLFLSISISFLKAYFMSSKCYKARHNPKT